MTNNNFDERPGNAPTNQSPQTGKTPLTSSHNPESNYYDPEQQRLSKLSHEVEELKQSSQSNTRNHHLQVGRLRRRLGVLTGILVAVIAVLGGTVAWLGSSLNLERAERDRLAEQVRSANEGRQAGIEQVADLQRQINSLQAQAQALSQQIPETFTRELSEIQDQLSQLETQIREAATSAERRQQLIDTLERSLNINQNQSPSPTDSGSESNSSSDNNSN